MSDVVRIRVRGRSMLPSLSDGDEVEVVLGAPVAAGDVVLFMDGEVTILHRVLSVRAGRVTTQGDGAPRPDAAFDAARILGVARVPRRTGLAMRRRVAELARASVRALLGRRVIAWLRATRSLMVVLAPSAAVIAGAEPPSTPASPELIELGRQIDNLTDLVRSLPEGDVKAGKMLELADVYAQRGDVLHREAMIGFNKKYDDWFVADGAKDEVPEPLIDAEPDEKRATEASKKAVAIFEHVFKKYPALQSTRALQQLLHLYLAVGESSNAIVLLVRVEQADPSSKATADSLIAIADFHFGNRHFREALPLYERAKLTGADLEDYVDHRLAWCRVEIANDSRIPGIPHPRRAE